MSEIPLSCQAWVQDHGASLSLSPLSDIQYFLLSSSFRIKKASKML